jgi:uncharacterized YigZ family protein
MDAYRTLASQGSARLTRERSRFLAFVDPAATVGEIEGRLAAVRRQYHDATHVCYAYRCRAEAGIVVRADDAGEPSGSAGPPILQQLEAAELVDVLAVVVRYFGGVKLGVGGLVRAYGAVTAAALAEASIVERQLEVALRLRFPIEVNAAVMRAIHRHGARVLDIRYDTQGEATVTVPPSRATAFADSVCEETGARARVERVQ